ncbi:hypothetical protein RU07_16860 [Agrobacterium tumefaciens]|uniref:Uncharacterized protein n=1 Tax=Agrobacterium tumefaciens TaxID=358 RepID=A0A0D0KRA7_AGRTU|nr:hypothetical protein RU07_16860 [Agrobacterium tumefaciens]
MIWQARHSESPIMGFRCATASRFAAVPIIFFEKLTKSGNVQHLLCQLLLQPGARLARFAAMIGLEYESVTHVLKIISRPKGRLNSKRLHCRRTAIWTISSGFRTAC